MSLRKAKNEKALALVPAALDSAAQAQVTAATQELPVSEWSVADLSALYAEQRSSLTAQARRILRSDSDAAEIVQESFLKFIMAAPELDTRDRALAYLRTTVNNLCLNQIRATGARPNLVAIDSDASQERLDEISAQAHIPFDSTLAAAEDAAIIREALSRLSQDQRTALVMWEMEGRTTEEIAAALETTPANVRHVVARSRASFVRVLSEWVIDEENGTTALEALSTSYKKAAELAKKSSKVALSLVLLLASFLGFNALKGSPALKAPASSSVPSAAPSSTPSQSSSGSNDSTPSAAPSPADLVAKLDTQSPVYDAKIQSGLYTGLGADGVPTGFTATDLSGDTGHIIVGSPLPQVTPDGVILDAPAMSYDPKAVGILVDQVITVGGAGTTFTPTPTVNLNGVWAPLNVSATSTNIERLPNGNYLVSSVMVTDSPVSGGTIAPVNDGVAVTSAPTSITVRLELNPGKTKILAEAIQVAASSKTSTN
jgi:RNA polymerase sigma factor (sigma-70 family)